jgi:hypothetical protein
MLRGDARSKNKHRQGLQGTLYISSVFGALIVIIFILFHSLVLYPAIVGIS